MKMNPTRSLLLALALAAFALPSFAAPTATKISTLSQAKLYNSDGSMTANNGTGGFGGGAALSHWFDGKKKTDGSDMWGGGGTYLPNLGNGGYCILDFTDDASDGYFVTQVCIAQWQCTSVFDLLVRRWDDMECRVWCAKRLLCRRRRLRCQ